MRTFVKGELKTIVDDNDKRIPLYLANGWEEEGTNPKEKDERDFRRKKAMKDVIESEPDINGSNKRKRSASDTKVNDALKASYAADFESESIDDGLIKK